MGADLLLTALVHKKGQKLNWTEGRKAARKLDKEKLLTGLEECYGEAPESVVEARKVLQDMITDLKKELSSQDAREAYRWEVGKGKSTWVLDIRGGTSWGDDPSEGWTAITNAYYFPDILKAIGFDLGGIEATGVDLNLNGAAK